MSRPPPSPILFLLPLHVEPHAVAILACDNPEAVVLDLVQPQVAGGQRVDFGGEARRNEAGRKSTWTGKHDVGINRQRWLRLEGPRGSAVSMPSVGRGRAQIQLRGVPLVRTARWKRGIIPPLHE